MNLHPARGAHVRAIAENAFTSSSITQAPDNFTLSPNQILLIQLFVEGLSDSQVAETLGITVEAVAEQVRDLVATMGVSSRTEAAITAIKARLVL